MTGAAMLWVGWFGFNAGSAAAADTSAGMAMLVTHLSAATASLVWMIVEWRNTGKPGLVGIVTGMVAGLATITPASGSVGPLGAIIIGASAGIICYYACGFVKEKLGIDDSLDVAAVHGVGGILGTLLLSLPWLEGRTRWSRYQCRNLAGPVGGPSTGLPGCNCSLRCSHLHHCENRISTHFRYPSF